MQRLQDDNDEDAWAHVFLSGAAGEVVGRTSLPGVLPVVDYPSHIVESEIIPPPTLVDLENVPEHVWRLVGPMVGTAKVSSSLRINAEVQELQNEGVPQDEAEMLDQFLEMFKLPFQEVIGEVGTFEGAPSCEPVSPGKVLAVPLNLETDSVEFSETRDRPQVVHSNDSVEGVVHVDRDLCIEEANRLDPPRTPQLETSPVLRFVQSYERLTRTYDILDGATTWSSLDIEFQSASSHSPGFIDVLTNEQWSGLLDLASQRILRVRDTCLFEGESLSNANYASIVTAFDASALVLRVYCTPDIPRTLIVDEIFSQVVQLVKYHTRKSVYALLDDDFRVRNGIPGSPEMPSTDVTMKSMAKTLILKACTVLHLLEVFTRTERVRDEYIVPLLDLCFESFSIDTASAIQHAALGFISACFLHNTTLRDHILSELVLLTDAPGKGVKVFKLHSRDGYISVVSATILSVLQGCPSISSYASNDGGLLIQFEAQQVEVSIKENVCTSFSESQKYVRAFIFQFVQRTMARSDSIPLLRSYLMRFIDDLKAVLFSAEWPVASDCLYFLCSFFSNMIGKSEFSINKRSVCIEALGSIFSRLQGFRMQLRDTPFVIRDKVVDFNPDGSVYDDAEQTQCVCGQEAHTELMIDCDSCHCWFHGKCVNITDEDVETIQRTGWVCGICTVRKEILDENMDYRDSRVDQTMISRQLLGNYLLNLKHKNPLHFQARFYHIARWISEEVNASEKKNISIPSDTIKLYQREWARDLPSIGQSLTLLTDTNDRIALKLAENCSLLLNFNTILRVLLKALTTKYVVLRSRVVKAIGEVVQVDPSILSDSSIQWAMKNGIVDKGSSVREAVVDLLGKYLLTQSHLIDSYFDMLAARVNDQGLSVRKRAIKIIQSLCLEYPNHTRYAGFCRILIERVDDEESIRDLVVSTIEKMWFSDSSKVISCRQHGTALSADFHGLVHQIVDTVAMLPSTEKLVQVITAVLQSPSSRGSVECCQDICICIVTHVLALDDSDPEAYPGILACIKTLAMFCEIRPSFVQPHCESLEPLLKGASGTEDDAELVSLVVRIITMAFPLLSEPRPTFVSNLEADLRTLTLSRPVKVLRTTIPCLCILAKSMSRWNIVRSLFDIYIGRLRSAFPSSTSEPKHLDTACRSLFTVGLLTRFCDPDALGQNTDTVYTLFKAACASSFAKLRVFGVEAMFSFYTRKPTEMLTSERLILGVLDGREHPSVQTHALRSLCEFLDTENMRLSYYQQKDTGATDLKQLPGSFAVVSALSISNDEDNGIISGMLQRYLPKILDLSRSREAGVRRGVLDVLSRFVQQNQVNPQLCVSTIACMSTDEVTQIRLAAQSVLRILINKHMGIVSPSLVPAVLDTYAYHISVLPVFNVYTMIRPVAEGVQNLLDISGASISSSLVSALLESLRFSCNGISKDDSRFNTFIIGILGGLSYSKDEPLTIAYHANKLCANTLGWLQPRLAAHYDTLEPSSTPESQAISRVASSICKLLHLRNWLQGAFTVEGPISAWSPYRSPGTEINSYRKDDAEDMSLLSIYKLDDPALYQLFLDQVEGDAFSGASFVFDKPTPRVRKRKASSNSGTPKSDRKRVKKSTPRSTKVVNKRRLPNDDDAWEPED